jgi:hypothetical protein
MNSDADSRLRPRFPTSLSANETKIGVRRVAYHCWQERCDGLQTTAPTPLCPIQSQPVLKVLFPDKATTKRL